MRKTFRLTALHQFLDSLVSMNNPQSDVLETVMSLKEVAIRFVDRSTVPNLVIHIQNGQVTGYS
jgi:hypothetical protein